MNKIVNCGLYSYNENDVLGKGNFSTVYKGINNSSKEEVAIKKIMNSVKYLLYNYSHKILYHFILIIFRIFQINKRKNYLNKKFLFYNP